MGSDPKYCNTPDPIVFMSLGVNTSNLLCHEFLDLFFLLTHHEVITMVRELPEIKPIYECRCDEKPKDKDEVNKPEVGRCWSDTVLGGLLS